MKFCDKCVGEAGAACDFCKYYNFNGDENGAYTGEGYCNFHTEQRDPESMCDDFYCSQIKEE